LVEAEVSCVVFAGTCMMTRQDVCFCFFELFYLEIWILFKQQ
jgi:hypothetical protein